MNHILLLEDIPEIRAWLKALVKQVFANAVITECSRVQDALQQVNAQKFTLALLDLGLPDGSGVDVIAAMFEDEAEAAAAAAGEFEAGNGEEVEAEAPAAAEASDEAEG